VYKLLFKKFAQIGSKIEQNFLHRIKGFLQTFAQIISILQKVELSFIILQHYRMASREVKFDFLRKIL